MNYGYTANPINRLQNSFQLSEVEQIIMLLHWVYPDAGEIHLDSHCLRSFHYFSWISHGMSWRFPCPHRGRAA